MSGEVSHAPNWEQHQVIASTVVPPANEGNSVGDLIMTDTTQVLFQDVEYWPSMCLTPAGFNGNKILSKAKLSLVTGQPDYIYNILPCSVQLPSFDEAESKEAGTLGLILNAYNKGHIIEAGDL